MASEEITIVPEDATAEDLIDLLNKIKDATADNPQDLEDLRSLLFVVRNHATTLLNQVEDRMDELEDEEEEDTPVADTESDEDDSENDEVDLGKSKIEKRSSDDDWDE
jgi:hypothetical protein